MTKKGKMTKISIAFVTALVVALCMMSMLFSACGKVEITLSYNNSPVTELSMYVGDSAKLVATVTGDDDADVDWSSSNESVATVRRGSVVAAGEGTAVITAQVKEDVFATCTITVSNRTVTISQETAAINLDESNTLTLTATASDGGNITWISSNPQVADVVGGIVTAYDIGEVTITAQRVSATATCTITVTQPSRPADYYKITKLTNIEVVADPGVWHYHADGSLNGDYGFETEPVHGNNTATVTLNQVPQVANGKYFYFRYQPDQVEMNNYYTIKLAITLSEDATLRLGSRGADDKFAGLVDEIQANTEKTFEYVGYRNGSEPFSVRVDSPTEADTLTLTVKLISVEAHDGTNLPDYHIHEEEPEKNYEVIGADSSEYLLESMNNAGTVNAPGKWYCWQGEGSSIKMDETKYNDGTITFNFDTIKTSGNNQIRFRPDLEAETNIKIEFTVTSNIDANIKYGLTDATNNNKAENTKSVIIDADGTLSITVELTLKPGRLFFIEVTAKGEEKSDASFTFSDVTISKEVA